MPWYGHNFEDAIVLSERLVKDDVYSSIHIQELELHVRDTKRGQEEITREIPNVSDEALVDLDERGIIRIGAHVKPGDILVGKITPKGETELSPEEKLLTAIFGEKAKDVKDSSLKVPPGMKGTVIDVKIFSRVEDQVVEKDRGERIGEVRRVEHEEKTRINTVMLDELKALLDGQEVALMLKAGTVEEYPAGHHAHRRLAREHRSHRGRSQDPAGRNQSANERIRATIDAAARERARVEEKAEDQIDKILQPDELPPGVIQLVKVYLGEKRKISVGDKMAGRHGNKGIVARIVPEEDMPFLPDGTPGGHRAQSARRAEPNERGPDPRDPPRLVRQDAGLQGQDPGVPRRHRGRDRRADAAGRARLGGTGAGAQAQAPRRDVAIVNALVGDLRGTGVAGATLTDGDARAARQALVGPRPRNLYRAGEGLPGGGRQRAGRRQARRALRGVAHRTEPPRRAQGAQAKGLAKALKELERGRHAGRRSLRPAGCPPSRDARAGEVAAGVAQAARS